MRGRAMCTSISILVMVAAALPAAASDWTRWRGPAGDGVSPESGWNPAALNGDSVRWRAEVGLGHSSVVVKDRRLYTLGSRQVRISGKPAWEDVVFCLDAATGKEIWRYAYRIDDKRWPGPGSTPLVDGQLLYTLSWQGLLHCFDTGSGAVRWRRDIVGEGLAEVPEWGFCASPVVDGNLLVLNAGRSGVALDKRTGKVIWRSEAEQGGLSTPVFFDHDGTRLAAFVNGTTLHAIDVASGEVQWSQPWSSYADPVIVDDTIVLSSGSSGRNRGSMLLKLGDGEPEQVWHNRRANNAFQSWVVIDGHAYGFRRSRNDDLECIDLADGEVRWSENMGDWGALTAADGKLIVIKGDGTLAVVDASPEGFTEVASSRVFPLRQWQSYPEGRPNTCWTDPVLADGRIYVRTTHGNLACVDVSG
jgi:outer membrane protein assembly factor BamB